MKIAVVTEDGIKISQHFGMAPLYVVFTVENGRITGKEQRDKVNHGHAAGHEGQHSSHTAPHGFDAGSQNIHHNMADTIKDCQFLIAGGMGRGAFQSLKSYNIEPVITDVSSIDEAVKQHITGNLPNLMDRLH